MVITYRATMIRKAITSETDKVTKIIDDITPEGLDMLEESIGNILTKQKVYHFTRGTYFGPLEVILTKNKYRDAINDQTFGYTALDGPRRVQNQCRKQYECSPTGTRRSGTQKGKCEL